MELTSTGFTRGLEERYAGHDHFPEIQSIAVPFKGPCTLML